MDLGLISVRYARALLKASTEAKLADSVYAEMQTLADSYMKVPELRFTIDNPMLSKDKKEQLLTIAAGISFLLGSALTGPIGWVAFGVGVGGRYTNALGPPSPIQ